MTDLHVLAGTNSIVFSDHASNTGNSVFEKTFSHFYNVLFFLIVISIMSFSLSSLYLCRVCVCVNEVDYRFTTDMHHL